MKYRISEMISEGKDTLITFGGAYSNHIHSATYAGKIFGFNTIGLLSGEEHLPLNETLKSVINDGMDLRYKFKESHQNLISGSKNIHLIAEFIFFNSNSQIFMFLINCSAESTFVIFALTATII